METRPNYFGGGSTHTLYGPNGSIRTGETRDNYFGGGTTTTWSGYGSDDDDDK
jgi:hypothetical protein